MNKIENQSTENLLRKKKFAHLILMILLLLMILDSTLYLISVYKSELINYKAYIPGYSLILVIVPILFWLRKLKKEISLRNGNSI